MKLPNKKPTVSACIPGPSASACPANPNRLGPSGIHQSQHVWLGGLIGGTGTGRRAWDTR